LPLALKPEDGFLKAELDNFPGAASFTVEILADEPLELAIPKRSSSTSVSFNGETVWRNGALKRPNAFNISNAFEDASFIRLRLRWTGRLNVEMASDAKTPGAPAGVAASLLDPSGISFKAVRVRWQKNLEAACSFWNVYRSYGLDGKKEFAGWSPEPRFTDFSPELGKKPVYWVQAVAADGAEGELSAPASLP
jgi:hypothetical protein